MSAFTEDGNIDRAQPNGPIVKRWPFADRGDRTTVVYEQRFQQRLTEIEPLPSGTRGLFQTYLVKSPDPQHIGGGIGEWTRTYANVPKSRRRGESFVYTYQFFQNVLVSHETVDDLEIESAQPPDLIEFTDTVASILVHDYFFAPGFQSEHIPLGLAPKIVRTANGFGLLHGFRGVGVTFKGPSAGPDWQGVPVTLGGYVLAEDSTFRFWMGEIVERESRYVPRRTQRV